MNDPPRWRHAYFEPSSHRHVGMLAPSTTPLDAPLRLSPVKATTQGEPVKQRLPPEAEKLRPKETR